MNELISQAAYAKALRGYLPKEAFEPDSSKLVLLAINILILVCGWLIGAQLPQWHYHWLWLYLPFAILMANSVTALAFLSHDLMHGGVMHNYNLAKKIAILSQAILWMPPTLWVIIHNRIHHNQTNMSGDLDRNYFYREPYSVGKRAQTLLFPSAEKPLVFAIAGVLVMWIVYAMRSLILGLAPDRVSVHAAPSTIAISHKDKVAICRELAIMFALHLIVLASLSFDPLSIFLAYLVPMFLGHGLMVAYIFTNHLVCPSINVNDPLVNSVSLRLPSWIDALHMNFSHHAEHHIFPSLNSDYYPAVRALLKEHYSDRMGYLLSAREAWSLLLSTPRQYQDTITLTDQAGIVRSPCHLSIPLAQEDLLMP